MANKLRDLEVENENLRRALKSAISHLRHNHLSNLTTEQRRQAIEEFEAFLK